MDEKITEELKSRVKFFENLDDYVNEYAKIEDVLIQNYTYVFSCIFCIYLLIIFSFVLNCFIRFFDLDQFSYSILMRLKYFKKLNLIKIQNLFNQIKRCLTGLKN